MGLVNQVTRILNIIIVISILVIIAGGGLYYYYMKVRKRNRTKEDIVDYSYFKREDSRDYIKIDDIKENMIITNEGTRFIGVLKCQGYDIRSAHPAEQASTITNFLGFINTINKPITYRQFSKDVDVESYYNDYEKAYNKVNEQLYLLTTDEKEVAQALKNTGLSEYERSVYAGEHERIKRQSDALQFRKNHLLDQMEYLTNVSGRKVAPEISETWVFDWVFDPMQFAVNMSEDEIYSRAKEELQAIANAKIHSLSSCGVKARRCSTNELIDMNRRYSSPISADRFKMNDIARSSYFSDIVTSTSCDELRENALSAISAEMAEVMIQQMEFNEEHPIGEQVVVSEEAQKKEKKDLVDSEGAFVI